jgi:hypothetical protein
MAPSTYLSFLFTISMIFISHAISPTPTPSPSPSPKLYQNVCKEPGQKDFEQRCLKLIEAYPQITLIQDYLTFCRSFLKIAAIDKAIKSQQVVREITEKYPSSDPIRECFDDYSTVVAEVKGALGEDPEMIGLAVKYAGDAVDQCERSLANEKIVNTSSIATLNHEMELYTDIVVVAGGHL